MTVSQIADKIQGKVIVDNGYDVSRFYCGDFLSRVMGKAPTGAGWLTVINNINVAGVAVMANIPLIILCETNQPCDELLENCRGDNVSLIITELPVFEGCARLTGEFGGDIKFSA